MAVLSSRAHERRSLVPRNSRAKRARTSGFSALARLYYLARPTKSAMLRRLPALQSGALGTELILPRWRYLYSLHVRRLNGKWFYHLTGMKCFYVDTILFTCGTIRTSPGRSKTDTLDGLPVGSLNFTFKIDFTENRKYKTILFNTSINQFN